MSAGTPYIGSKINLISKAEIRYQGTLYQVDTKEATVTLAKVRSFGTENRQVPKPIPPRNEVYEFIIFRGSDIKDLNVIDVPSQTEPEDPAPQDPAILSATQAPPQSIPPPVSQPSAPTHPRLPSYSPFPPPNIYSPFGMPYVRPPMMMGGRGAGPMHPSHPAHAVPIITPKPGETLPQPSQQSQAQPPIPVTTMVSTVSSVPAFTDTLSSMFGGPSLLSAAPPNTSVNSDPQASSTPLVTASTETIHKASLSMETEIESPLVVTTAQPSVPIENQQVQPPASASDAESSRAVQPRVDSTTEESGNKAKEGGQRGGRRGRNYSKGYEGRGGHRGNRRGYRGNYRGRGGYRSQQRPPRGGNSNAPVYRYESEFDFESANARFKKEAFEEEFKQLHVDDKSEMESRRVSESNGDEDPPLEDRTEVSVASSEGQLDNDADVAEDECYDKSKSFFDSISRESSGPPRRPDRSAERELNTETFGVSNYRSYNRYQRGRGRGRGNRGGQRYNRGGNGNYGNKQNRVPSEKNRASTKARQD